MLKRLIRKIESEPRRLFLIDGAGAVLSAVLLGFVLTRFEGTFGIPASTLYILASAPVFFSLYDLLSYRIKSIPLAPFLNGIATMNLLYCCLSVGFAFYHSRTITSWGWAYILLEVSIIITLAAIELRCANRLKQKASRTAV